MGSVFEIDRSRYKSAALTTSQTGYEIGVSDTHVRSMVRTGKLPGFKIGDEMRIRIEDIEAYMRAARVEPSHLKLGS